MGSLSPWLVLWLGVSLASAASLPPQRAVPVTEETLSPSASNVTYVRCDTIDLSEFSTQIADESNDCALKSSYRWSGTTLPTADERRALCNCTTLIKLLQQVEIPRCSLIRNDREISYAQLVRYAFGLCSPSGGVQPTTTPSPTLASTTTPSPLTNTPTTATPTVDDQQDWTSSSRTSSPTPTESKSKRKDIPVGTIIGGVIVVVVIIAILIIVKCKKRRRAVAKAETRDIDISPPMSPLGGPETAFKAVPTSARASFGKRDANAIVKAGQTTPATTGSSAGKNNSSTYDARTTQPSEMALWEDPVLLAVRVPYDTVFFGPLLSRGGYGEVYKATYRGETVAIKQLLPERRKDLAQIDAFLHEVKLMSTLEHERIVRFIGVAWHALSDACVIVEYMENGDLRTVLAKWDREEHRPQGFDADKVKIALHVAHALTYLHSLQPVVVHRDLKSKNILLDANYDAKLTDFGVSRERADSTMTGGVGTSLWMAPEVMLGERYDEKADVFSFGVVLSELDTQKLPYAHAKEAEAGHKLPDSAILQMVSLGRLQVAFSDHAHPDLVLLGRDCVQLDVKNRPSSAEVLHRVHQVLRSF